MTGKRKATIGQYALNILPWLVEPSGNVAAKQRRRVRLLSAFLLFIAINALIGSLAIRNAGGASWYILLVSASVLAVAYVLSRTGYHGLATGLAITVPAFPALAVTILQLNDILNTETLLWWLALPLLISSLLLSPRKTVVIAIAYLAYTVFIGTLAAMPLINTLQLMAYMTTIFFFVAAITAVRQTDQSEIEHQLAERTEAERALQKANDEMEALVAERTKELKTANEHLQVEIEERKRIEAELQKSRDGLETLVAERTQALAKANEELHMEISERERAEEAIRKSEEKFAMAFRNSPSLMTIATIKEGRFIEVNPAYCKVIGYSYDELVGHTVFEVGTVRYPERRAILVRALEEEGRVRDLEVELRTKSGGTRTTLLAAEAITINGEKCLISASSDITEHKAMEQEREMLLQELKDKAKELEQIIYIASHDLRSPLVNIQGFTSELEQSLAEVRALTKNEAIPQAIRAKLTLPVDRDIPDALKYILAGTAKIDALLSGLLRLSRLGRAALDMKKINMNEMVNDIGRTLEFDVKNADIKLEISDLPDCYGDKTQINQVFSNLIDNAIKYRDTNRPSVIKVSGHAEDGQVIFCVEDNGIGIAPEHQQKVFEIFQRLNTEASKGEGLGLSLVRRILDRHYGRVWLESEPGKGSRFFISLPAAETMKRRGP